MAVVKSYKQSDGSIVHLGCKATNAVMTNGRNAEQVLSEKCDTWDGTTTDTTWYSDSADEYEISTAAAFAGLMSQSMSYADKKVLITADIDMGGLSLSPLSAFAGELDGNGHRILNLASVFVTNNTGIIKNVRIGGSKGIATNNNGSILNCIVESSDSTATGATGGIATNNNGKIINCHNAGADINGYQSSGGIAASNNSGGVISGCTCLSKRYVVGSNAGLILDCYGSTGLIQSGSANMVGAKTLTGEYSGTGAVLEIALGIQPKLVMVFSPSSAYPAVATAKSGNNQSSSITILSTGFKVTTALSTKDTIYAFIALV